MAAPKLKLHDALNRIAIGQTRFRFPKFLYKQPNPGCKKSSNSYFLAGKFNFFDVTSHMLA